MSRRSVYVGVRARSELVSRVNVPARAKQYFQLVVVVSTSSILWLSSLPPICCDVRSLLSGRDAQRAWGRWSLGGVYHWKTSTMESVDLVIVGPLAEGSFLSIEGFMVTGVYAL